MRRPFARSLLGLATLISVGLSISAWAADSYQVNSAATATITEHGACRKITNAHASSLALMVPTKTAPEWSSAYLNPPAGVTVAACTDSAALRFRNPANTYLSRTNTAGGSRTTFTISAWVKQGMTTGTNVYYPIFSQWNGISGSSGVTVSFYNSSIYAAIDDYAGGSAPAASWTTAAVFRDPTAWYHVVAVFDTTQVAQADRFKLYINGTAIPTTFGTVYGTFSQGYNTTFGSLSYPVRVGGMTTTGSNTHNFDGYMADYSLVDGQALLPSSFGGRNSDGMWVPKVYAGAYGTNGFRLDFADASAMTATTLGKDRAGSNNLTPNNFSITAGATYDPTWDAPRSTNNGGNGVGNYATLNPLSGANTPVFSNGNQTVTLPTATNSRAMATMPFNPADSSGYYWEVLVGADAAHALFGIVKDPSPVSYNYNVSGLVYSPGGGVAYENGSDLGFSLPTSTTGDVIGLRFQSGNFYVYKNGVIMNSGNPVKTGLSGEWWPAAWRASSSSVSPSYTFNFGQRPFSYTQPAGTKTLSTYSLPIPAITDPSAYFKVATYTGNGSYISLGSPVKLAGTTQIANSLRFQPASSANLTRIFGSGDVNKFTLAFWAKKGTTASGSIIGATNDANNFAYIRFENGNLFNTRYRISGTDYESKWLPVYNDPASWHHYIYIYDRQNATAADRQILYVDGIRQPVSTSSTPSSSLTSFNGARSHYIGYSPSNPVYYDGYLADMYFLDGQAAAVTVFGAFDINGNWAPKAPTGLTYGTNGYHLDFSTPTNAAHSGIGNDSSGNSNHFTAAGFMNSDTAKFTAASSHYLYRTPPSGGSAQKLTYSTWFKLASVPPASNARTLVAQGASSSNPTFMIGFNDLNSQGAAVAQRLTVLDIPGSVQLGVATNMTFTDTNRWYHVVVAIDTTQATAADRVKVYVDGVQVTTTANTTYGTNVLPALNTAMSIGTVNPNWIGRVTYGSYFFDGEMGDTYFVDGQQLTASDFGQTVSGVWTGKNYTGTYGTTGYHLAFKDRGLLASIGKDTSGLNNNFTANLMTTSVSTNDDVVRDAPTPYNDGTFDHGNFATLNPIDIGTSNIGLSGGNLTFVKSGANFGPARATLGTTTGKWYVEMTGLNTGLKQLGVVNDYNITQLSGDNSVASPGGIGAMWDSRGYLYQTGAAPTYGFTYTTGDVVMMAFDTDTGKIWFGKNGTWNSGNPETGTTPAITVSGYSKLTPMVNGEGGGSGVVNFGQRDFAYTPPAGFKALNTNNFVNTGFIPDLVINKNRSSAVQWAWYDRMRGVGLELDSTSTALPTSSAYGLYTFQNGGFTAGNSTKFNTAGDNYISFMFKKGVTPGLDIITYTGNGSVRTIAHTLAAKPAMMIIKNTSGPVGHWVVYHQNMNNLANSPSFGYLTLSTNSAFSQETAGSARDRWWNSTEPTSSVFSLGAGSSAEVNTSGSDYVAYLFAEVPGYSKIGGYVGNGATDGTFVYTGFKPAFVMIKRTDIAANWRIVAGLNNPANPADKELYPNLSNAENTFLNQDMLSNGFKLRTTDNSYNTSNGQYIYAAFAETPFKYGSAR